VCMLERMFVSAYVHIHVCCLCMFDVGDSVRICLYARKYVSVHVDMHVHHEYS
jgi:hypothetical protein